MFFGHPPDISLFRRWQRVLDRRSSRQTHYSGKQLIAGRQPAAKVMRSWARNQKKSVITRMKISFFTTVQMRCPASGGIACLYSVRETRLWTGGLHNIMLGTVSRCHVSDGTASFGKRSVASTSNRMPFSEGLERGSLAIQRARRINHTVL